MSHATRFREGKRNILHIVTRMPRRHSKGGVRVWREIWRRRRRGPPRTGGRLAATRVASPSSSPQRTHTWGASMNSPLLFALCRELLATRFFSSGRRSGHFDLDWVEPLFWRTREGDTKKSRLRLRRVFVVDRSWRRFALCCVNVCRAELLPWTAAAVVQWCWRPWPTN